MRNWTHSTFLIATKKMKTDLCFVWSIVLSNITTETWFLSNITARYKNPLKAFEGWSISLLCLSYPVTLFGCKILRLRHFFKTNWHNGRKRDTVKSIAKVYTVKDRVITMKHYWSRWRKGNNNIIYLFSTVRAQT